MLLKPKTQTQTCKRRKQRQRSNSQHIKTQTCKRQIKKEDHVEPNKTRTRRHNLKNVIVVSRNFL